MHNEKKYVEIKNIFNKKKIFLKTAFKMIFEYEMILFQKTLS